MRTMFVIVLACFSAIAEARCALAGNSSTGTTAAKFGVHEVLLTDDGRVANPFDTLVTVTFTPAAVTNKAMTVNAARRRSSHRLTPSVWITDQDAPGQGARPFRSYQGFTQRRPLVVWSLWEGSEVNLNVTQNNEGVQRRSWGNENEILEAVAAS